MSYPDGPTRVVPISRCIVRVDNARRKHKNERQQCQDLVRKDVPLCLWIA